ncbi:MAG: ATP-binding protein [Clostridia bacterium]|nr:ATP-binding protein [Clostridia bacterium]
MKFLGREDELRTLEYEYSRDNGFVVVYGRRRVGKTRLIKEFLKGKLSFYLLPSVEYESLSLSRFAEVIAREVGPHVVNHVQYESWEPLFNIIANYKPDQKKVIVLDEFQYLVKANKDFLSLMQYIWDEILYDKNIMLIICGSYMSMMKKYALSSSSPLYGRRTAKIYLKPLTFTQVYEGVCTDFSYAAEMFTMTGGIPKYIELFDFNMSVIDNIMRLISPTSGFLYDEPDTLFKEVMSSPAGYFSVLRAIADGNHKLESISRATKKDTTSLPPYISFLIDLGYVRKVLPITEKPEIVENPELTENPDGTENTNDQPKKGLYLITDEFVKFWFKYVSRFIADLELGSTQIVLDELEKDYVSDCVAHEYESICRNILVTLCNRKEIDLTPSKVGVYWLNNKKTDIEIDICAVDRRNKKFLFGECKYHNKPVDTNVLFGLIKKADAAYEIKKVFNGYKHVYALFSKSGFTDDLVALSRTRDDIVLVNEMSVVR